MKYSEVRGHIKSGDILAFSNEEWDNIGDLQSQIVKIATQSEFSHCAVAWVVCGRVFVIEASPPLVRIRPLSNVDKFYWIPTDKPMLDEELEFALDKVAVEKYSRVDAVKAFFNRLNIGKNKRWQCSELVIAMRRLSGLVLNCKATPADVVKAALGQGYKLHFVSKD